MGEYSPTQKLYKVDGNEIVDVESNLNYNWTLLDDRIKKLIDWFPTDVSQITGNIPFENGFKFLKRETNTHWYAWDGLLYQDFAAFVPVQTLVTPAAGWENADNTKRLMVARTFDKVYLRGKVRLSSGAELPIKTLTTIATLPLDFRPTTVRHYLQPGGNSPSGQPCISLIVINTTGTIQFIKYGTAQGTAVTDRFINLYGIEFPK